MKLERSKIEYPLWRKKVDSSIFDYKGTTIPTWACTSQKEMIKWQGLELI